MSMEDILKVLVDSRQQGGASQQGADPMANLIGSLLGGQAQTPSHAPLNSGSGSGGADLSGMMGLLESLIGGQAAGGGANDPIMAMISPFVPSLAKKANISPEIAMIVISFVVHKLLAHHPTSGRDSNAFNFDEMLGQMSSGRVDTTLLRQSGMVNELSQKTGLDEAATEQALQLAFMAVGKTVSGIAARRGAAKPTSSGSMPKPAAGGSNPGGGGTKRGKKIGD